MTQFLGLRTKISFYAQKPVVYAQKKKFMIKNQKMRTKNPIYAQSANSDNISPQKPHKKVPSPPGPSTHPLSPRPKF